MRPPCWARGLAISILCGGPCGGCGIERWFAEDTDPRLVTSDGGGVAARSSAGDKAASGPGAAVVTGIRWYQGSLDEALAAANEGGKLVFAEVGTYWCPPCHRLDEETFTARDVVEALAKNYVAVRIDAEKGDGPQQVERYRVQAYPTLLVLEPSGVEKGRIVDFVGPVELLAALRRIEEGGNVLDELERKVEMEPDDLETRYRLGHAHALAGQRERAEKHYTIVLAADPKGLLGFASKVAYDRAHYFVHKLDHDPERAIELYRSLQRRFPDSVEALRAYRQIGRALHELGRDEEAIASLEQMVAEDPQDVDLRASYGWFSFRNKLAPERALESVMKGVTFDPDNAELHYLQAELLALLGRDREALAAIERAAGIEPRSAFYRQQVQRFRAADGEQVDR